MIDLVELCRFYFCSFVNHIDENSTGKPRCLLTTKFTSAVCRNRKDHNCEGGLDSYRVKILYVNGYFRLSLVCENLLLQRKSVKYFNG